ncbi:MAG: response regulator, partial [Chloroflexi bacterium]
MALRPESASAGGAHRDHARAERVGRWAHVRDRDRDRWRTARRDRRRAGTPAALRRRDGRRARPRRAAVECHPHGDAPSSLSERQTHFLKNIHDAGEHLLRLINDVLDLSKVEARRIELHRETIDVDALLAPVRQTALGEAGRRTLHFDADVAPGLAVNVDPLRIRQILLNLISNAAKFTPPGGTISLRASVNDETLELEVADTGIGIPADKVSRVFGTFERFHEGHYEAQGTGLGLALTKQLVELHGGTIDFVTAEGRGTRFTIHLPQVVVPLTDDRVLIVEDEPRDAQLIAALARHHGLATEVTATAASAIASIRRRVPIGIVLDLRLPDARGESVLDELHRVSMSGPVPTVIVTVEDDEGATRLNGA